MKKFMLMFVLFCSCLQANPPANTYRSTPNSSGGYSYYSSRNQYLGRSTSNTRGGSNYYNSRGSQYNRTNGYGTNIGKFQSPSDGSNKYSYKYNYKFSGKSSSKSSSKK